jgi:biotin-dependent carboxylase-like uncharacterized protein
MSALVEVISSGFQCSVQDIGRFGHRGIGVPVCGVSDPFAYRLANRLLGNDDQTACLEFRGMGPSFKAVRGDVKMVVAADVSVEIVTDTVAGVQKQDVPSWSSFTLKEGSQVNIGVLTHHQAGLILFSGGLGVAPVMGSRSSYVRSQIGKAALKSGDMLTVLKKAENTPDLLFTEPPVYNGHDPVRVVLGPQDDYFTDQSIADFLSHPFEITRQADRMGMRLNGPTLVHRSEKSSQIKSDGIALGAIQVPGNGQAIVLLNDAQTVGGYPKIATVISADLGRLANLPAGSEIKFQAIDAKTACDLARAQEEELIRRSSKFIQAQKSGFIDLNALYEENIIGGMVNMAAPEGLEG